MYHKNSNYKKAGVAILIKVDFKTKVLLDIKRDIYNNSSVHQNKTCTYQKSPKWYEAKNDRIEGKQQFLDTLIPCFQ